MLISLIGLGICCKNQFQYKLFQNENCFHQPQVLYRYSDANRLLIDCLNSNCEVTVSIWQETGVTQPIPQKELEDRAWQGD